MAGCYHGRPEKVPVEVARSFEHLSSPLMTLSISQPVLQ